MALVNDGARVTVGNEAVDLVMYAFPLYAAGGIERIRGVDLVGHSAGARRFWVVELKVAARAGYGESPLRALYEALIYGAVVESNMSYIRDELKEQSRQVEYDRPGLLIAAPGEYWGRWAPNKRIGDWWTPFAATTSQLAERLNTAVATISLGDITYRFDEQSFPHLVGEVVCAPVDLSPV